MRLIFPLKPSRGEKPARQPAVESLWRRSSQERVNNNKGEVGEAFLKVTWSVPGKGRRGGRGREGRGRWGAEYGACCRRNRILSWPVWSQRRNIRRWLQWDAAGGGVRWVGGWMGGEGGGWLTLEDALCILMDGHTCTHTHTLTHTYMWKMQTGGNRNVPEEQKLGSGSECESLLSSYI